MLGNLFIFTFSHLLRKKSKYCSYAPETANLGQKYFYFIYSSIVFFIR